MPVSKETNETLQKDKSTLFSGQIQVWTKPNKTPTEQPGSKQKTRDSDSDSLQSPSFPSSKSPSLQASKKPSFFMMSLSDIEFPRNLSVPLCHFLEDIICFIII
eukprot:scpid111551/ scgid22416/ 